MSEKRPVTLRILRFVVAATWYLGFVGLALLVVGNIAFAVGLDPNNLHVQAPVVLEWVEGGDDHALIPVGERPAPIYLEGLLQMNVAPVGRWALLGRFLPLLGLMVFIQWGVWQLRQVIKTLWDHDPFHEHNPRRLTNVGIVTLVLGPFIGVFHYIQAIPFSRAISIPGATLQLEPDLHWGMVFTGIVILVVAQVHAVAVGIKREHDFTV